MNLREASQTCHLSAFRQCAAQQPILDSCTSAGSQPRVLSGISVVFMVNKTSHTTLGAS